MFKGGHLMEASLDRNHKDILDSANRETLPLPVTGLILCGGKSKRMGRPKAFLPYGGRTIVEHLVTNFAQLFDEVFLVANEPDAFSQMTVDVVKDILPNRGPVCGILSGLLVAKHEHVFVAACDMPLVDKKLVREMSLQRRNYDVVVLGHDGQVEPLLGFYSKSCIKSLEDTLFSGKRRAHEVLSGVSAKVVDYNEVAGSKNSMPAYFNVNTPLDYSELLAKTSR
jgi:molybdenum cofactor guanylyltransferase